MSDVNVSIGAQIDELIESVEHAKESVVKLGEAFGLALSIEGIKELINSMAELGEQIERTGAMLGVTATQVQQLSFASKVAGGSADTMARSIERMEQNLQRGMNSTSLQARALQALGINAKTFIELPVDKQVAVFSDAVSKFADGGTKTAAVMAVMGRGAAEMIPQLNLGSRGMQEMHDRAIEVGAVMSEQTVKSLAELEQSSNTLKLAMQGLGAALVGQVAPALKAFNDELSNSVGNMTAQIATGVVWENIVAALVDNFKLLATWVKVVWQALVDLSTFSGEFSEHWKQGMIAVEAANNTVFNNIEDRIAEAKKAYREMIEEIGHESEKPKVKSFGVDTSGLADQMKAIDIAYRSQVQLIDATYGKFIFTENAKTAALQRALDERYAKEIDIAQKTGKGTLAVTAKYEADKLAIMINSAKAQEASWNTLFGGIQSSFNGQLRGMLAGTTSFTQAMKTMLGDLIIFAIEQFEKMAFEWAAKQLSMTVVNQAQDTARAASTVAAQEATLPARAAKFVSDITANAAATFAGIMANLSPILGPAAAGPAAAGQAEVLAQVAKVPKFDVGTPLVLRSGLAEIHEGEMITPAVANPNNPAATSVRSAPPPITIVAWDGASVKQWLTSGGATLLAKAVAGVQSTNPSLRPSY